MFQRLDKSFFQEPKELGDLINKGNFIHKYLPKQTDIDNVTHMKFMVISGIFTVLSCIGQCNLHNICLGYHEYGIPLGVACVGYVT